MGRGLSALLAPVHENGAARENELREIPLELIEPNPRQPRRDFDEGSLVQLADSLRERGVLQPVLLRRASLARRSARRLRDGAGAGPPA